MVPKLTDDITDFEIRREERRFVFLSDDFFDWRVGKWGRWKIGNVVRRVALIGAHGLAFVPGLFLLWIILSLGAVLSLPAPFFAMGILLPIWVLVAMLFVAVFRFVRKL